MKLATTIGSVARAATFTLLLGTVAMAQSLSPEVRQAIAPGGRLRAAINYGNTVLAQKDVSGQPVGISVALAKALGARLGVPVDFVAFDAAGRVFDALAAATWDVAFLAIDPARATGIDFTAPYIVIEGTYLVAADSPLRTIADVDQPGIRIAVGNGSAYELYLTRTLRHAALIRAPTSGAAITLYGDEGLDAVAGVKNPLVAFAATHPGVRVMPGRFMAIEQAMGLPKGRPVGAAYLRAFINEMKASGFVAEAIAASGQADATVAP